MAYPPNEKDERHIKRVFLVPDLRFSDYTQYLVKSIMDTNMPESISTLTTNPAPAAHTTTSQKPAQGAQPATELTQSQQQKASLNVSILESAAAIIGVKDDPLALVFSTAIERINQLLAPELGKNALQKSSDLGLDVSPEATAERIASLSTSFFSAFRAQHPEQDEASVLTNFMQTIRKGIETGFGEARDILEGLEVLEGDIAQDIDQTFTLVQEKLAAFEAMIMDMNDISSADDRSDGQLENIS